MAASPDTLPPLSLLAKHGMADYSARAITFDKPVGPRGLQADLKPTSWKVTITSLSAARPMVSAVRADLAEAEMDARNRFLMIFKERKNIPPVSMPEAAPKKTPKAAPVEDDDDGSDLI